MKAIIIGGGMAGLMTARVLADFYEEITIIDRDKISTSPDPRPGTPQARHPHHLTPKGRMILEQLFPGLNETLLKNGAHNSKGKEILFDYPFGHINLQTPTEDAACSRSMLEWHIHQYVQRLANISFLNSVTVTDLKFVSQENRICGITGRGEQQLPVELSADLVVFAGGYHSHLPDWLKRYGYEVPQPEILTTDIGYSTRHYSIPGEQIPHWDLLHIEKRKNGNTPTCVVSFMEGEVMEIILGNIGGLYPPTTTEAFEQELSELNNDVLTGILRTATPLEAPRGYRMKQVFRQHYEKMPDWPAGLLVIGDALCSFDPIYGTGITVAALQAASLQTMLSKNQLQPIPDFEVSYLKAVQHIIEPSWWINAVADLRHPAVQHIYSEPLKNIAFAQAFLDKILEFAVVQNQMEIFGLIWLVSTSFYPLHELFNEKIYQLLQAAGYGGVWEHMTREEQFSA
ncbi:FAD-dependent oxidoreductase [Chitinophaga flava]|uniref:FAD dependent oxidoreductase n=1 Tax=Chitinophaga flava TaxID=2259036 RepID=A0A365XSW8_9BACT|nr:FAD-dependent monooxygenase [Chitinophaga flava]RBL89467.1 FAD dependent oxidoreductase [Chitinophaga flava]